MKAATAKQIKDELKNRSTQELLDLCLRLSRFKKENKELLTYLLFEIDDEEGYVRDIKYYIDESLEEVNSSNYYYLKKGIRKILREIKKYIRYSVKKESEVELLLHFCEAIKPYIHRHYTIENIFDRQLDMTARKIDKLHEDLQYDYGLELENIRG